jgi:hypothetical protein
VFQDVQVGDLGQFREAIQSQIRDCRVVLVILGRIFYSRMADLSNQGDVVRMELCTALASGKKVIPVVVTDRPVSDFCWPSELEVLDGNVRNYVHLCPRSNNDRDFNKELPRLVKAVAPYLPEYWRRRHWKASVAAWVMGVLLSAAAVIAIAFLSWLTAAKKEVKVQDAVRRVPLDKFVPEVQTVGDVFPKLPGDELAPVHKVDAWKFDFWLRDYAWAIQRRNGVFGEAEVDHCTRILTHTFKDNHVTTHARLCHVRGVSVWKCDCFLMSEARDGDGPPRPVYRQMKITSDRPAADVEDGGVVFPIVELIRPSRDERLLLILIMKKKAGTDWPPGKGNDGFKFLLEVTRSEPCGT